MAKYHITANGEVKPCHAFIKKCPLQHYATAENARSAAYLNFKKNRNESLQKESYDNVNRAMMNSQDYSLLNNDTNSKGIRQLSEDIRKYSEEHHGRIPEALRVNSLIHPPMFSDSSKALKVRATPKANFKKGIIEREWTVAIADNDGDFAGNEQTIDFQNDYDNSARIVLAASQEILQKNYIIKPEHYEEYSQAMLKGVKDTYVNVEEAVGNMEKLYGPFNHHDLGTFRNSTLDTLVADVNYNNSALDEKTFDKFLTLFEASREVPHIQMSIKDDAKGQSDAYWSLTRMDEDWSVQLADRDGETEEYTVDNAADAANLVHDFVLDERMPNSSPDIAMEKGTFVYNFFNGVNDSVEKYKRRIQQPVQVEKPFWKEEKGFGVDEVVLDMLYNN